MTHLPANASDQQLVEFVDAWASLLEQEDYEAAYAHTAHSPNMGWTPHLIRQVIKSYNDCLPTQKVTLHGEATDVAQRKIVERYESPRQTGIGYIWYDLNIDGLATDLTATFDIRQEGSGLVVVLDDIHVM